MDDRRFDDLARSVAEGAATRRAWLRGLVTLPLLGALAAVFGAGGEEAAANGAGVGIGGPRRRRRKARHDPGAKKDNRKGKRRRERPRCSPDCEGKVCGDDNGCGGICTACPTCHACSGAGVCEPRADGAVCGTLPGPSGGTIRCCNGQCPGRDGQCVPVPESCQGVTRPTLCFGPTEGCPAPAYTATCESGPGCTQPGPGCRRCFGCSKCSDPGSCVTDDDCAADAQGRTACVCGACRAPA